MKLLLEFTDQLYGLVSCDIPLKFALLDIARAGKQNKRISDFAYELFFAMDGGSDFGDALFCAAEIRVPSWYSSFVSASGESGELKETLKYLKTRLEEKKKIRNEIAGAVMYPVSVILLTFLCGVAAVMFLPQMFAQFDLENYSEESGRALCQGTVWLVTSGLFVWGAVKSLLAENPCALFMRSFSFLADSGVNIVRSLECCVALVEKDRKLCTSLMDTRQLILDGMDCSQAFCNGFEMNGMEKTGRILNLNLDVCGDVPMSEVFRRTANLLDEENCKKRKRVLAVLPSITLCIAAVYMGLILKGTVMPFILYDGGIL